MACRFRLSSLAEQDITEIIEFIAADNPDAAIRSVDRFTDAFDLLANNPEMGERHEHPREELRRFSIDSYVAIYQSLPDGILVVRVFHGARRFEDLL